MAEKYSIVCTNHVLTHSSITGHLGCFHLLVIVNNPAPHIGVLQCLDFNQFMIIPYTFDNLALWLTINLILFFPSRHGGIMLSYFPHLSPLPTSPRHINPGSRSISRQNFLLVLQGATDVLLLTINTETSIANLFESGCYFSQE